MRGMVVVVVGVATLTLAAAVAAKGHPSTGEQCAAAKLKAATKKTAAKLACYQRAVAKGAAVPQVCLCAAEAKFNAAFARAETKGGCVTVGDRGAVETMVDDYVAALVNALPTAPTSSTTTSTSTLPTTTTSTIRTTTTGTTLACGGTLTPACNGSCPANHVCVGTSPMPGLPCFCM